MTLFDGGDDCSSIEVLRGQAKLVGEVASDSKAWRRVNLADGELAIAPLGTGPVADTDDGGASAAPAASQIRRRGSC